MFLKNYLPLWSLLIKEVMRFIKVGVQTILGPAISSLLFLAVFSLALSRSINYINDIPLENFIAPGLIMMTIFIKEVGNINYDNLRLSILDIFSNTIEKIKKRGKVNFRDKSILDIYIPVYDEIIANADKQASVMIDNAKGAASEEADKIKAQAKSELDQEAAKVRNELRGQVSSLVMQGVNSVLDKEVDSKTHKDMLSKLSQSL